MLAAGASGEFDVLLLDDLSRLTRDSGGKPKFLLSGLLCCGRCDAHYIISNQRGYACSSFINGNACTNTVRVRRDAVEHAILDPVRKELLARDRAERMAAELQALYVDHVQRIAARADVAPRELQDLVSRIERLRDRLKAGDPDMAPDEIQAASVSSSGSVPSPAALIASRSSGGRGMLPIGSAGIFMELVISPATAVRHKARRDAGPQCGTRLATPGPFARAGQRRARCASNDE